jgi:hypothetical protein
MLHQVYDGALTSFKSLAWQIWTGKAEATFS